MKRAFLIATKASPSCSFWVLRPDGTSIDFRSKTSDSEIPELLIRNTIEKVCGLRGVINQVISGNTFNKIEWTQEYLQSEAILAALRQEGAFHAPSLAFFISNLDISCRIIGIPYPALSAEKIMILRRKARALTARWEQIPTSGSLRLRVEVQN